MSEVLVRQELSTAAHVPGFRTGCPAIKSRTRPVDWENGALLEVLIANRPMLVDLALGLVGCACLAEDVVHDVFIKLMDFPDQHAVRQPVAYVARMVRNASVDASRRQSLESDYHAEENDGLHVPSPEPSPEAALLVRDMLRHVYDALEQLPARSRAAFELVRLREETLQSAARALDVSQTLVHSLVRDAEKHCADCLDARRRGVAGPAYCNGVGSGHGRARRG